MQTLKTIRNILDKTTMGAAIICFMAMVIVGTYQICSRYFFGRPSTVSEELLTYLFTWMSLFAASYVFGKRDHMRMAFLADKLKGNTKKILEIVIELIVLVFIALAMVWGGFAIMKLTMSQATASLGVPMGLIYAILPISGCCTVLYCILNIIDLLQNKNLNMKQEEVVS